MNRISLDISPIPEKPLFINDLSIAVHPGDFETEDQIDKALNNPHHDGNIRVYVPLDLSEDTIISRLHYLVDVLGVPNYNNESAYSTEVDRLIQQLDIYNRVWVTRDMSYSEKNCTVSQQGKRLARHMVEELLELDEKGGSAECFPYDQIEELKEAYDL